MELIESVRLKLLDEAIVNTTTWPCYIGFLPDDQDQAIGLFDTGGLPADTIGRENVSPTFSIIIRAGRMEYSVSIAKWKEVFNSLQDAGQTGTSPDRLSGVYLMQAMATHPLTWVDEKQRSCCSLNFRVIKKA